MCRTDGRLKRDSGRARRQDKVLKNNIDIVSTAERIAMHLEQAKALLKLFVIDLKPQARLRFRHLASAGFGIKKRDYDPGRLNLHLKRLFAHDELMPIQRTHKTMCSTPA